MASLTRRSSSSSILVLDGLVCMRERAPPKNKGDRPAAERARLIAGGYQRELFARAKGGIVIACVDTGSGKTLVAAMLVDYVYQLENARPVTLTVESRRQKIALFLVNLVPLAHKQPAFLNANISAKVKVLYDEIDTGHSSRQYWQTVFEEGIGVVVSTVQCVLNAVIRVYLNLQDTSLLVFEEAHHAVGNHAYARIMEYYRLLAPLESPKILA